jgi:hypothetical protein
MSRLFLPLLLLLTIGLVALAQEKKPDPLGPKDAGASVYKQVLPATVWIHSDRGAGKRANGSGSLVDKGRRLVLTNYHVVGNVKKATVFFPDFGKDKKAIPERQHYLDLAGRLGIAGEVVELDKEGDLALIRIDRVPAGAAELPLAAESPDPGQTVHSIGNPGKSGALWVYTPGKVRQVYSKKWRAKLDDRTILPFQAKVIETDSPTNPGDSGGPLVNDKGELVGVTQGGVLDADALSLFVDLSEVKRLVGRRSVQALRSTDPPEQTKEKDPAKPRRDAPLKSSDDGKFFGAATWKRVQTAADRLFKEKDVDLLIETVAVPPKSTPQKVAAMPVKDREKFFEEIAQERVKAEKISGVYLLICKNPPHLHVELAGPAMFPGGFGSRFLKTFLDGFKAKKFDEALNEGLNMILDFQGLGEKKDEKKDEKKEEKK